MTSAVKMPDPDYGFHFKCFLVVSKRPYQGKKKCCNVTSFCALAAVTPSVKSP